MILEAIMAPPYYDDEGNELNPDLIKMPSLCITCKFKDDPEEEILCTLTRFDQEEDGTFVCHAYVPKYGDATKEGDEGLVH